MKIAMFIFAALALLPASGYAASKWNAFYCTYIYHNGRWEFKTGNYWGANFTLAPGEAKTSYGAWTSNTPGGVNYAICSQIVGSSDENKITVKTWTWKASSFNPLPGMIAT